MVLLCCEANCSSANSLALHACVPSLLKRLLILFPLPPSPLSSMYEGGLLKLTLLQISVVVTIVSFKLTSLSTSTGGGDDRRGAACHSTV